MWKQMHFEREKLKYRVTQQKKENSGDRLFPLPNMLCYVSDVILSFTCF